MTASEGQKVILTEHEKKLLRDAVIGYYADGKRSTKELASLMGKLAPTR